MKQEEEEVAGVIDQTLPACLSSFVDNGSIESHRYYLSRRTVLEMLKDRGFVIPRSDIDISLQDFRIKHGEIPDIERLTISALHKDDPSIRVLVVFSGPGVVKLNVVRAVAAMISEKGNPSRLIMVIQNKITNQALKMAEGFSYKVEIFQISDLLVNVTKHELKPKHQILSDEEKGKLLKKFSIEEKQLPRMSQKDAIARYYGLEKGQVLKVTYGGELTQLHVTYRCVW